MVRPRGSRVAALLLGQRTDPRPWQGAFALLLSLALALLAAGGALEHGWSWLGTAALCALVATTMAALLPWERVPTAWMIVLPVADLAIGGLASLDAGGLPIALILVIPALWCTVLAGRRGAGICWVATALFLGVPALLLPGGDGTSLAVGVLLPFAAAGVCYPFSLVLEAVESERAEVGHHQRIADAILDTVDVGLVLLDERGRYVMMNKRHQDFMRLAFPEGHDGRAGALGMVFAENGTTALTSEEMPSYRASHGEEFDDARIWVGEDPLTSRALSVSGDDAASVRQEQLDWLKTRNACGADAACLEKNMRDRVDQLMQQ